MTFSLESILTIESGKGIVLRLHFANESVLSEGDLAAYSAPPVMEVTLGFQFDSPDNYNSLLAADFWRSVRSEFPRVEEQAPLDPAFETFGGNDGAIVEPRIEFVQALPQPRFMLIDADAAHLLQFQRDRLHFNWRGYVSGESYPRYPAVRTRFESALAIHSDWASSIGWRPKPTQAEIAYVNRIPLVNADGEQCGLSYIFPWLTGLGGFTENGNFHFRRKLLDETDKPVGRLHFIMQYGTDEKGAREARVTLTVRGQPADPTTDNCLMFLDESRKVIVHTFTSMTSAEAHKIWEKNP